MTYIALIDGLYKNDETEAAKEFFLCMIFNEQVLL
jgi:pentatricopeptide repeat protein